MSYSFSARGATKSEVMEKVTAELDKVVAGQPIHAADRAQAQAAAEAFLDIIPSDVAGKDFYISVSGSVGWSGLGGDAVAQSVGINISASLQQKT